MFISLVVRRAALALAIVGLCAHEASAQFEFAGSWAPLGTEDVHVITSYSIHYTKLYESPQPAQQLNRSTVQETQAVEICEIRGSTSTPFTTPLT